MNRKSIQALTELKAMLPYIAAFNAAAVAVCSVVCVFFGFEWRLFTGLAVGNALMAANFLLIGMTVEKIIRVRDFRRGQILGGASYGLRYAGMFAVLAILLSLGLISPFTAVIPLFFPKIYYTFFYVRREARHGKDE